MWQGGQLWELRREEGGALLFSPRGIETTVSQGPGAERQGANIQEERSSCPAQRPSVLGDTGGVSRVWELGFFISRFGVYFF